MSSNARPATGPDGGFDAPRRAALPTDRYGMEELKSDQYEKIRDIGGHRYETPPAIGYNLRDAQQRFTRFAGDMNPKFSRQLFDSAREKIQAYDKRERGQILEAMAVLYAARCGRAWMNDKRVDHAEFERMLLPNYAPKFADARRALSLPRRPIWYRMQSFENLENISRIPLMDVVGEGDTAEMRMPFEDWYQLFWNYAMPFNANAFYHSITSQSMAFTKEFVEELATYLRWRLETVIPHEGQPILYYGARVGKLAKLLNDTKILPVPVLACSDEPVRNPYVISIPNALQHKFVPAPLEKLKLDNAIEKYKPAIVLLAELRTQQDITQDVRKFGCVKEYLTMCMPNGNIEGHAWDTWGNMTFLAEEDRKSKAKEKVTAAYYKDGWRKFHLHQISRYAIHKYDQRMCCGVGAVMSFHRAPYTFTPSIRWKFFARRLATRY